MLVAVAIGAGGVAIGLGGGSPRPEIAAGARDLVAERAAWAAEALDALERELAAAVDSARAGSARAVSGDVAPGPALADAAAIVRGAEPTAQRAREATNALAGAMRARTPGADPAFPLPAAGELSSIADQLERTAEAADAFAAMRQRADRLPGALEQALAALDAGDLAAAGGLVASARADREALADWEVGLDTLPVWLGLTGEMIGAMERIIEATERGDAAEARAAAAAFAELGDDAATADRALRIAMSEGGAAVAAPALARLAAVMSSLDETRARIGTAAESAR